MINEKGRYKEAVIAALLISIAQSISWVVKNNSQFLSSVVKFTDKQLKIFGVNLWDFSPVSLVNLGIVVVIVFGASFGPFIAMVC